MGITEGKEKGNDRGTPMHKSIYQLVMVFWDEGSLLRLLSSETPVTMEERGLSGPVMML